MKNKFIYNKEWYFFFEEIKNHSYRISITHLEQHLGDQTRCGGSAPKNDKKYCKIHRARATLVASRQTPRQRRVRVPRGLRCGQRPCAFRAWEHIRKMLTGHFLAFGAARTRVSTQRFTQPWQYRPDAITGERDA